MLRLTTSGLQAIVDQKLQESRFLEFKQQINPSNEKNNHELSADVSAMANTDGGRIIFGIAEIDGLAGEIVGVAVEDVDREISRLLNVINNGIEPCVPSVDVYSVDAGNSRCVIVADVPASWLSPHFVMVNNGSIRVYGRHANGKYVMDYHQIREAFVGSALHHGRLSAWSQERVQALIDGSGLFRDRLKKGFVLHMAPVRSVRRPIALDMSVATGMASDLQPPNRSGCNTRINFDGLMTFADEVRGVHQSYCQLFRDGKIEAVWSGCVNAEDPNDKYIGSFAFERAIKETMECYSKALDALGVPAPWCLFVTICGALGARLAIPDRLRAYDVQSRIDRDLLVFPDVVINQHQEDMTELMRPICDSLWNAAGWPRSMNYSEDGKWQCRK